MTEPYVRIPPSGGDEGSSPLMPWYSPSPRQLLVVGVVLAGLYALLAVLGVVDAGATFVLEPLTPVVSLR